MSDDWAASRLGDTHGGCRVCSRTDVKLKADETLRMHVHAQLKGSSFLAPRGNRCRGAGHPPKGVLGRYAVATIAVLRAEFPDLEKQHIADVIGEAIQQHRVIPSNSLECLLDERGVWRLCADLYSPGFVTVSCTRIHESNADRDRRARIVVALGQVRR